MRFQKYGSSAGVDDPLNLFGNLTLVETDQNQPSGRLGIG